MFTSRINHFSLVVQNIIIFQLALSDTKIVLLYLFLGSFQGFCDPGMLNHLSFIKIEFIHDIGNTVGSAKQSHQFILEGDKKLGFAGVTLPACTSAKLKVNPPAFVPLRSQDGKTPFLFHSGSQFNIRTTSGHVCSNGNRSGPAGLCNDFTFTCMLFGVQNIMWDFSPFQHPADRFRYIYTGCTDQYRLTFFVILFDSLNRSVVFLTLGPENHILFIIPDNRAICRNYNHIQVINFVKLTLFRSCSSGHTGKFVIHPEIILKSDGSVGLSSCLNFHLFFRFNGLVQSV